MSEVIGICQGEECNTQVSEKVAEYSHEHFEGAILCFECQNKIRAKNPTTTNTTTKTTSKNWEDDMVSFETLLNDAHKKFKGRFSIETSLIASDMTEKWAVVKATITISNKSLLNAETGDVTPLPELYEAHGDATQQNCSSSMIAPHFLRMAETRAIARALRWATNNAKTAEEEKG